jgi:hypothetical protein
MRDSQQPRPRPSRAPESLARSDDGLASTALAAPYKWSPAPGESPRLTSGPGVAMGAPGQRPARFDRAGSPAYTALRLSRSWREARREAHLPAEQDRPQAAAWVSRAHGLGRRPAGARAAAGQRAQTAVLLSPAARHIRRGTARIPRGWYGSSVDGSSWPRRPARIAGWPPRSCSRPGRGRPPSGRAAVPRLAWGSRRAAGSATRLRAIGPGAGFRKRPGTSSQARPSQGTTTSSSLGRRS